MEKEKKEPTVIVKVRQGGKTQIRDGRKRKALRIRIR